MLLISRTKPDPGAERIRIIPGFIGAFPPCLGVCRLPPFPGKGIEGLLSHIVVPTLVLSVRDDAMGWRTDEARRTCAVIRDCRVEEVAGGGHVAPLLIDHGRILDLVTGFWAAKVGHAEG